MDLTEAFFEGWNSQDPEIDNPYMWSSPNWLAFHAGGHFVKQGTSKPIKCKMSRGYSLRIFTQSNEWLAKPSTNLTYWSFDRRG